MSTADTIHIKIDDRIRARPELLAAVNRATEYMETQMVEVPPPSTIDWQYADDDGKLLRLTLRDDATVQRQIVQRNYWTRWIEDPVNQKICVLKAWGELLSKRSDRSVARINHLISQLAEESLNAGQDTERPNR